MLVLSLTSKDGRVLIGPPEKPIGVVELIRIGPDGKVRVGFDFPKDIPVNRESVAKSIIASGVRKPRA